MLVLSRDKHVGPHDVAERDGVYAADRTITKAEDVDRC
jgi:hypothetical protein